MINSLGHFADPAWETRFLSDVRHRMFWVVLGPWMAGTLIIAISVYQAYLRIGFGLEWTLVTGIRLALIAAIFAAFLASRRGFDNRSFKLAAIAVLVGLVLFNVTAVLSGASDWDRIARATIIQLFLIGLSLMILPREAFLGLAAIWKCLPHRAFADDPAAGGISGPRSDLEMPSS